MLWGHSSSPIKKTHTGRRRGLLPTATWVNHHGEKPDQPSRTSSPQMHAALTDVLTATSWETLSLKHPAKPCLRSLKFIIRSEMFIFKLLSYGVIYYIVIDSYHKRLCAQVCLFAIPWTAACQAPLSTGFFSGKNTGVGCYFFLQGNLPDPRDQTHVSCVSRTGRWVLYHWATWEAHYKGLVPSFLIFIFLGLWFPFNKRPFSSVYTWKTEAPSKRDNFSFSHLLTGPLSTLTVPDP